MTKALKLNKAELLLNETPDHSDKVLEHMAWADRFVCIVAFARKAGFNLLFPCLKQQRKKGMTATFVVGLDLYQTDPEVLEQLMGIADAGNVKFYMGAVGREYTFHPKIYLFQKGTETRAIVGSANMTMGGLQLNHEASAVLTAQSDGLATAIDDWISALVEDGEVVAADSGKITAYASSHKIYSAHMKLAAGRAKRAIKQRTGNVDTLLAILEEMRRDRTKEGFDAVVKRRAGGSKKSAALLKQIATARSLTEASFRPLYERLISEGWHSGGLHRGKNIIIAQAPAFQSALQSLEHAERRDARSLFELLRQEFKDVKKVGTNVITEILHSLDDVNFVVMNKNSVSGMGLAKITGFPEAPNKGNLDGQTYARFCSEAAKVRGALGLRNFSELDAVFNYAYWK